MSDAVQDVNQGAAPQVRTLFLMLDCYFPPTTGTPQGIWRNLLALSRLGPIAVFSVGFSECTDSAMPGVERWLHIEKPQIQHRSPLQKVVERVRRLVFPAEYPYLNFALEKQTHEALRQLIDDFKPTIAVLDHWLNAIIPSPLRRGNFPVVVASHDVEWQLTRDLLTGKAPFLRRLRADAEVLYFRRVEARLYREADRTWAVSEKDRLAIQRFAKLDSQVRTLPAVIELDRYEAVRRHALAATRPRAQSGPTLVYAGSYDWSPNADAAHALISEIYPRLRERYPHARLLFVGHRPTVEMEAAARADDNIIVTGEVEDVRPYLMEADIVPVPLLVGGGMRVKILEAFAAGVPVVSTTKGCEGIAIADGRELLIRDGTGDFVSGIMELWENPASGRQLAERAFDFMRREHSMELLEARVRSEVEELIRAH